MCNDNSWWATLLLRARADALGFNWRASFWGGSVRCVERGEESFEHFVWICTRLGKLRIEFDVEGLGDVRRVWAASRYTKSFLEIARRIRRQITKGVQ